MGVYEKIYFIYYSYIIDFILVICFGQGVLEPKKKYKPKLILTRQMDRYSPKISVFTEIYSEQMMRIHDNSPMNIVVEINVSVVSENKVIRETRKHDGWQLAFSRVMRKSVVRR